MGHDIFLNTRFASFMNKFALQLRVYRHAGLRAGKKRGFEQRFGLQILLVINNEFIVLINQFLEFMIFKQRR